MLKHLFQINMQRQQ